MRQLRLLGYAMAIAVALGGCTATVAGGGYGPDLVEVSPGVQVIADYDEPIFYSDGYYWRYGGNAWYRSSYYTGGWAYATPPPAIVRIDRPYTYAHYRPRGWQGHAARPAAPPPRAGWRGNYVASSPAPRPAGGWRGAPPAATPPPAARPAPAPHMRAAPPPAQPSRGAPDRRGWRR
jgi:hypothetical protein